MTSRQEFYSALLSENNFKYDENDIERTTIQYIIWFPALSSFTLLCLGFVKALLGCCAIKIDRWRFDYVQSFKMYEKAGRKWKLFINTILFILLPFAFCSKRCSSNLSLDKNIQERFYKSDSEEESLSLLNYSSTPMLCTPSTIEKNNYSSETIFDDISIRNSFTAESETMLVKDTDFVVNAMNESYTSLKKNYQENEFVVDRELNEAKKFVEDLLTARIVYRRFSKPIGGVRIKEGQFYSIRGYFLPRILPSLEHGYQFATYSPLKQVYNISNDNTLVPIAQQIYLDSKGFRQYYSNWNDVFNAADLSLQPSLSSPCINVMVQNPSMYSKT